MIPLEALRGRYTITVPEAGELLGLGRDSAYAAAARGDIPHLKIGRRLLVPVPGLLALLGVSDHPSIAAVPAHVNDVATDHLDRSMSEPVQ